MTDPVRHAIQLNCNPDDAFAVFTTQAELWWPPGHRRWPGSTLRLEPIVGGRFAETAPTGEVWLIGEVTRLDPPHSLQMRWYPGQLPVPSEVTVRFTQQGAGTLVEVKHVMGAVANATTWPDRAARFAEGWQRVLANLADTVKVGRT